MLHVIVIEIEDNKSGEVQVVYTNSWTKQMAQAFGGYLGDLPNLSSGFKDTAGVSGGLDHDHTNAGILKVSASGAGVLTSGVILGTGTTTPTADDFKLVTPIVEGTSSGQLTYGATVVNAVSAVTGGYRMTIQRQVNNNSGADIAVKEMALYVQLVDGVPALNYYMMLRDLLSSTVVNSGAKTFKYHLDFLV